MNIAVVGAGYVGLVTAAVFADLGNEVVCVEKNEPKLEALTRGRLPIYEPGLEEMVTRNCEDGRLTFTGDLAEAVRRSEIIFIAVDTPARADGSTDLARVEEVAAGIADAMDGYRVIVNKSTVPVGTGDLVRSIIESRKKGDFDFEVVSNPEFLREGSAIADTLHPERIVVGTRDRAVAMKLIELYAPLERPMLITDVNSAEMIKYASNSFLATRISFINAIADICEQVGADVGQVIKGMSADSRIGPQYLQPGLGYGGSCFPKDTESLVRTAAESGCDFELLRAVVQINRQRVPRFVSRMESVLGGLTGKTVAVLGLSFKPNTDDLREAKALELVRELRARGARVRAYDPVAMVRAKEIIADLECAESPYEAAAGADALAVATEWNEFKLLNLPRIKSLLRRPVVFDGRNLYDPAQMEKLGFEYYSIGR